MTQVPFRSAAGLPAILQLPVGSLPVLEQRSEAELQQLRAAVEAALQTHEKRIRRSLRWLPRRRLSASGGSAAT